MASGKEKEKLKKEKRERKRRQKIFCIGFNKTGTTSLTKVFKKHKYKVAPQNLGEKLFKDWAENNFTNIIKLCERYKAFQDRPFSMPNTYKHLDEAFPNSKFILTVRSSSDEWYNSFIRFQKKIFGGKLTPNSSILKRSTYCYKGWMYDVIKSQYNTPDDDLYNKEKLVSVYSKHNKEVIEYFKDRPDDLLVMNLKDKDSYQKFCKFVEERPRLETFPHLNRTK